MNEIFLLRYNEEIKMYTHGTFSMYSFIDTECICGFKVTHLGRRDFGSVLPCSLFKMYMYMYNIIIIRFLDTN